MKPGAVLPCCRMSSFLYTSTEQRHVRHVLRDLVRSREILRDLVWKDLRARYRYAFMGFLWAIIEPLALMLILTFVFTFVFKGKAALATGGEGPDFAVMLLCGLIFWMFLATALTSATHSLIDNQNLVKKIHFTREAIPLAAVCFPLVNLAIGFALLLILHVLRGGAIGVSLLYFPFVFAIQFLLIAGLALLLSCAHVHFRDIGNMVTVAITFGFYATPIFYPLEFVTQSGRVPRWAAQVYQLNPMAGIITAYRQILFESRFPDLHLLLWPVALAAAGLTVGVIVFRRSAPTLSDHL